MMMNDWDKNNLQFILALDENQFDEWYSSISDDDADYAMELLKAARAEVAMQIAELYDNTAEDNLSDAKEVLGRFTLKGSL
jgi:hypothetical protein